MAVPDTAAVNAESTNFAFLGLLSTASVTSSILRFLTSSVESCASSYVLTKLAKSSLVHSIYPP